MQAHLRPVSAPEFAVVVDELVGFCRSFGLDGDPEPIVAHWHAAVKDMPARIIRLGIADLCRTWKYRKIPLPADLAAACEPHMAERRELLNRATWMLRKARMRKPDPAPEDRVDPARVAEMLRGLAPGGMGDAA